MKCRPVKANLYPHDKDLNQLADERLAFAEKLREFIFDDKVAVIYFDETTFHSRMTQSRAWTAEKKLKVPSTKIRGSGFTVFGAVGECLKDNGYFEIHDKTKGTYFL